jgi:hypothetical protein
MTRSRSPRPPRQVGSPRHTPSGPEDRGARDPMGRMALFSETEPEPPRAAGLFVECSSCLEETSLSAFELVKLTFPFSVHLPLVRRYGSFMRCPACGRRTWLRVGMRV